MDRAKLTDMARPITLYPVLDRLVRTQTPTFFDIGANEGQTTDQLLALRPQAEVHLFEPTPRLIATIRAKHAGNTNVIANDLAVGDRPGKATFHLMSFSQTSSLLELEPGGLYENHHKVKEHDAIEVQVTTIDAYMADKDVPFVDFCKIDTQGYSLQCLKGAAESIAARRIGVFQVEVLLGNYYKQRDSLGAIDRLLGEAGYRFYTLLETDTDKIGSAYIDYRTGEALHFDVLYVSADCDPFT